MHCQVPNLLNCVISVPNYHDLSLRHPTWLHPDGCTIFVSTNRSDGVGSGRTYTFYTRQCRRWRHVEWVLPFHGQGYFDGELDAWVGLYREIHGRVCVCIYQVPSHGRRSTERCSTTTAWWRLCHRCRAARTGANAPRSPTWTRACYIGAVETSEVGTPSSPSSNQRRKRRWRRGGPCMSPCSG